MNVLIIDNSIEVSNRLKSLLLENTNSTTVLVANDIMDAYKIIHVSNPDIILLDIDLQKNFLSFFLSEINKYNSKIILIALSIRCKNQQFNLDSLPGIHYLFDKYYDFEKLPGVIDSIAALKKKVA